MNEKRRIASDSDKITIGESFVRRVTGSRCITQASTTAGHMIQRMLLLLLVGTLLVLTGVVLIVMRLTGLMIILRIGATAQTRGIILTLAAT